MTRRRLVVALAVCVSLASLPRGARAAEPARLVYMRGTGASSCPDEGALRRAIAARMGQDPFSPEASLTIRVQVSAEQGRLRGLIVVETEGVEKGSQTIDEASRKGSGASCEELIASIALAVSVALDAESAPAVTAPAAPVPEAPPMPAKEATAPTPPPVSSSEAKPEEHPPVTATQPVPGRKASLWVAPGLRASIGYWPTVAFAPDLFAELRYGSFGLGVEGRFDLPATVKLNPSDQASVERWSGAVVPCGHISWFGVCGVASFGGTRAFGPTTGSLRPYVAFGGRLGVDVPLAQRFHVLGTVDVTGSVIRAKVLDSNGNSLLSNPVEGSLGIALLVSIF